jgi:NADPH:quinone reductase-like Zn-dependent oxidoreductase
MSSLRLCALVGLSAAAAVPATMNAFVAESASSFKAESEFRTPQVGDLHKVFGDLPHPCEVVVKVAASSINPCDAGTDGERTPKVLGSDIAGTVVEVGDQCTLKVGDEVWGDIGANG